MFAEILVVLSGRDAEEIAKTSAVICTLLGALLGISTAQYNKDLGKHEPTYGGMVDDED